MRFGTKGKDANGLAKVVSNAVVVASKLGFNVLAALGFNKGVFENDVSGFGLLDSLLLFNTSVMTSGSSSNTKISLLF